MSSPRLSDRAVAALRDVLGAEYTAIWVYELATAFAAESRVRTAIDQAVAEHRARRDTARRLLRDAGVDPPAAEPAYSVRQPVTDQASAIRLLITAESDCAVGWRAALEACSAPQVRSSSLDGLTVAATRATRWRITIGEEPAALAFPGVPR